MMTELQEYMKDYFMQHKSEAHEILKQILPDSMEEFCFVDEFLLSFMDKDKKKAILLLSEDHDHADGYFVEAMIKRRLEEEGFQCLFVTEREVRHDIEKLKSRVGMT